MPAHHVRRVAREAALTRAATLAQAAAPLRAVALALGTSLTLVSSVARAQAGGVPFAAVADSARRAPAADLRVTYGPAPSQFAELRLPRKDGSRAARDSGQHPTVLLLHGGCWLSAYGVDHVAGIAESLRQAGFAVLAAEYRRVGEKGAGVPGTFDDVRAAYDSLRAIAPRYGLDTARVLVMGHSAGGHLALWLASEPGVRVRGVIALAGVTDLAAFAAPSGCGSAVPRLMGGRPAPGDRAGTVAELDARPSLPARYAVASPITRAGPPPGTRVVLVVADADRVVPMAQSEAYLARFPSTESLAVPGGHFDLVAPWTPAWARIVAMMRELSR